MSGIIIATLEGNLSLFVLNQVPNYTLIMICLSNLIVSYFVYFTENKFTSRASANFKSVLYP